MATSFWLHLLCLYLAGVILRRRNVRKRKRRFVIAAFCSTVLDTISVVALYGRKEMYVGWLYWGIAILGLLSAAGIAYGRRMVLTNGFVLFVVTVLMGGLFQLLSIRNVGMFCLAGTLLLPVCVFGITSFLRVKETQTWVYEVRLLHKEEVKCLSAFLDTGNRLRLYGSQLPVVLVDETYLAEWINAAEKAMPQKLVFLPYKGVGGKGILRGIRLQCELNSGVGAVLTGEVAAVAAEHRLFQGCEYQMLLQPEVLSMSCVKNTREGEKYVI